MNLDLAFYEIPIEEYINLYDYIINTRETMIPINEELYKSRSIIVKNKQKRYI